MLSLISEYRDTKARVADVSARAVNLGAKDSMAVFSEEGGRMPGARYQVVDEQLEDQRMQSQVFAQSDDVEELLNELPALKASVVSNK